MCRRLLAAVVVCGMMVCLGAGDAKPPGIGQLSWLAGAWVAEKDGLRVEEHWTPARGGTMMGIGRVIQGEQTVFYEFLRIEQAPAGGITYHAAPKGRSPATPFKMIELTPDKVIFENPDHDFPNRITYQREGEDNLAATIEGMNGENQQNWIFQRQAKE